MGDDHHFNYYKFACHLSQKRIDGINLFIQQCSLSDLSITHKPSITVLVSLGLGS